MQDQDSHTGEESEKTASEQVTTTRLKSSAEVVVEHHDVPPPGPPDKQIHTRRPLPRVPERTTPPTEDAEGKPDSSG